MSIPLAVVVIAVAWFVCVLLWVSLREYRHRRSRLDQRLSEARDAIAQIEAFDLDEEWLELDKSEEER